jgi:hypothetical protein
MKTNFLAAGDQRVTRSIFDQERQFSAHFTVTPPDRRALALPSLTPEIRSIYSTSLAIEWSG